MPASQCSPFSRSPGCFSDHPGSYFSMSFFSKPSFASLLVRASGAKVLKPQLRSLIHMKKSWRNGTIPSERSSSLLISLKESGDLPGAECSGRARFHGVLPRPFPSGLWPFSCLVYPLTLVLWIPGIAVVAPLTPCSFPLGFCPCPHPLE